MTVKYRVVSLETICISPVKQTQQVVITIFMYTHVYVHVCVYLTITIKEKEDIILRLSSWRGEERRWAGEMQGGR